MLLYVCNACNGALGVCCCCTCLMLLYRLLLLYCPSKHTRYLVNTHTSIYICIFIYMYININTYMFMYVYIPVLVWCVVCGVCAHWMRGVMCGVWSMQIVWVSRVQYADCMCGRVTQICETRRHKFVRQAKAVDATQSSGTHRMAESLIAHHTPHRMAELLIAHASWLMRCVKMTHCLFLTQSARLCR